MCPLWPAPAFLKLELDDLFSLLVDYFYVTKPEISSMLCHSEHSPRLVAGPGILADAAVQEPQRSLHSQRLSLHFPCPWCLGLPACW